mmetsp:Transcript_73597/g.215686  ORF Transcript_73597/g.215686 Transcript_73597/m.215686 type:complete len:218 (+) Transcript_73597:902-1555(+)
MRGHGDGHELIAARVRQDLLPRGLGGRVLLQVLLLRQLREVCLREPVDVAAVEARAGRGGHDDLRDLVPLAALEHVPRAAQVHVLVELPRVEGPDRGAEVPDAVGSPHCRSHALRIAQVALHVLDAGVLPGTRWLREDVEGHHALRPPLDQHLHKPLPDKAAAARHDAVGRDRRVRLLGGGALQRRQRRRRHHGCGCRSATGRPLKITPRELECLRV